MDPIYGRGNREKGQKARCPDTAFTQTSFRTAKRIRPRVRRNLPPRNQQRTRCSPRLTLLNGCVDSVNEATVTQFVKVNTEFLSGLHGRIDQTHVDLFPGAEESPNASSNRQHILGGD